MFLFARIMARDLPARGRWNRRSSEQSPRAAGWPILLRAGPRPQRRLPSKILSTPPLVAPIRNN